MFRAVGMSKVARVIRGDSSRDSRVLRRVLCDFRDAWVTGEIGDARELSARRGLDGGFRSWVALRLGGLRGARAENETATQDSCFASLGR